MIHLVSLPETRAKCSTVRVCEESDFFLENLKTIAEKVSTELHY